MSEIVLIETLHFQTEKKELFFQIAINRFYNYFSAEALTFNGPQI